MVRSNPIKNQMVHCYIYKKISNHSPQIIKQLPKIISDRLSTYSSERKDFNRSNGEHENAPKRSGYNNINLKYQPLITSNTKQRRHRNIMRLNPPFSRNVSTNVASKFLQLLDKHFTPSNSLHKLVNHNTMKVSYCYT